jgi:hypothetical protein
MEKRNYFVKTIRVLLLLSCTVLYQGGFAQILEFAEPDEEEVHYQKPYTVKDTLPAQNQNLQYPYTFELKSFSQFHQSTRMVFELTNNQQEPINNFWLHISLLDKQGIFLYSEQPLFFSNIAPGRKGIIEMMFESVGKDDVGYIVLYPGLLEINRKELPFETQDVRLILPATAEGVRMAFYTDFE